MHKIIISVYFALFSVAGVYLWIIFFNGAEYHAGIAVLAKHKDSLSKYTYDVPRAIPYKDGSVVYVKNDYQFQRVYLDKEIDERFPIVENLSEFETLILLSILSGMIGGIIQWLLLLFDKQDQAFLPKVFLIPVLSAVSGFLIFLMAYYFPSIFSKSIPKEPGAFILVSIAGGLFTQKVFDKIKTLI